MYVCVCACACACAGVSACMCVCMFGLVASPFFLFIEKSFHVITQLGV